MSRRRVQVLPTGIDFWLVPYRLTLDVTHTNWSCIRAFRVLRPSVTRRFGANSLRPEKVRHFTLVIVTVTGRSTPVETQVCHRTLEDHDTKPWLLLLTLTQGYLYGHSYTGTRAHSGTDVDSPAYDTHNHVSVRTSNSTSINSPSLSGSNPGV